MRKALSLLLAVLMVLSSVVISTVSISATEGSGEGDAASTETVARTIPEGATEVTQENFATVLEGGEGNFYLASDVTIEASVAEFKGTLYGNGKTITTSVPVFAKLTGATVYDLTINASTTDGITTASTTRIGALAETATSVTVENVRNNAKVALSGASAGGLVGYIVASEGNLFKDCVNAANVSGKYTGGIVGYLETNVAITLENCRHNGTISATDYAGGIVGSTTTKGQKSFVVKNCVAGGSVTGSLGAGGIAGAVRKPSVLSVESCVSTCTVAGNGSDSYFAGGIIGIITAINNATFSFKNCVNVGSVTHKTSSAGGIVGAISEAYAPKSIYFENCRNMGKITTKATTGYVGGIIGCTRNGVAGPMTFKNCVNSGTVVSSVDPVTYSGSIAGNLDGKLKDVEFQNCTNTGEIIGTVGDTSEAKLFGAITHASEEYTTTITTGSNGSEAPTGEIGTAEDFLAMEPNGSYKLTADIELDSSYKTPFIGMLDGDGHTITVSGDPVFVYLGGATVKNLRLEGSVVDDIDGYVGALALVADNVTLEKITSSASVEATDVAGGLVGQAIGALNVSECVVTGNITASSSYAGGVVGLVTGTKDDQDVTFTNCSASCEVSGGDYSGSIVGRIDGTLDDVTFTNCTSSGSVVTTKNAAAGILGYGRGAKTFTFTSCSSAAALTSKQYAGGIVAVINGEATVTTAISFTDCINTGKIDNGSNYSGGIAGYILNYAKAAAFENCINTGEIVGKGATGGIAGYIANETAKNSIVHTFTDCVNTGAVSGAHRNVAGILASTSSAATAKRCINTGSIELTGEQKHNYCTASGIMSWVGGTGKALSCVNTGDVSSVTAAAGIGGYWGEGLNKGSHDIFFCVNTGDILSTAPASVTNYNQNSAAGIVKRLYGASEVNHNVVAGTVRSENGTAAAIIVYCTGGSSYKDNIVLLNEGDLAGADPCLVKHIGLVSYQTISEDRVPDEENAAETYVLQDATTGLPLLKVTDEDGNPVDPFARVDRVFLREGVIDYILSCNGTMDDGNALPAQPMPEGYEYYFTDVDETLMERLGTDYVLSKDGTPMHKDVVVIYNKAITSHFEPEDHVYPHACSTVCRDCGEPRQSEAEHTYDNNCDADCNVCGETRTAPHAYDNACDAECNECGAGRTPADHVYENACDSDCNICGEKREAGHTPGAEADCTNAQTCTVCGEELAAALGHTPGAEADCTNAQTCTVCGEELAAALGHTPGAEADCTNAQTCTVCGEVLAKATGHRYSSVETTSPTCTEEGYVTITCGNCGAVFVSSHDDVTGDPEADQYLIDIPFFKLDATGHKYENTKYDADSHWNECTCGAIDAKVEHTYDVPKTSDTQHWNECTCGAATTKEAHNYEGGDYDATCSGCDYVREVGQNPYTEAITANGDSYSQPTVDGNTVTFKLPSGTVIKWLKSSTGYYNNWVGFCINTPEGVDPANVKITRPDEQTRILVNVLDTPTCANFYWGFYGATEKTVTYTVDWNNDGVADLNVVLDITEATLEQLPHADAIAPGDNLSAPTVEGNEVTLKAEGELKWEQNSAGKWSYWLHFQIVVPEGVDPANVTVTYPDGSKKLLSAIMDETVSFFALAADGETVVDIYWGVEETSTTPATFGIDWNSDEEDDLSVVLDTSEATLAPKGLREEGKDVTAEYAEPTVGATVYCIDIVWGSLKFTYTAASEGTWDPEEQAYVGATEGGWSCDEEGGNAIIVTNRSNAGVKVTIENKDVLTGLTLAWSKETFILATADNGEGENGAGKATSETVTLTIEEGTITESGKIGTVTVTITDANTNE